MGIEVRGARGCSRGCACGQGGSTSVATRKNQHVGRGGRVGVRGSWLRVSCRVEGPQRPSKIFTEIIEWNSDGTRYETLSLVTDGDGMSNNNSKVLLRACSPAASGPSASTTGHQTQPQGPCCLTSFEGRKILDRLLFSSVSLGFSAEAGIALSGAPG